MRMQLALRRLGLVLIALVALVGFGGYQGFGEPLFLFRLAFARPPTPLFAPDEVQRAAFGDAVFTGKLADPSLIELSGLVASRRTPGVFFAIQDSGGDDRARLYALDASGRSLGTWEIPGVENKDWEDLAAFHHEGRAWIAIADIGDNQARREELRVFVVPEPDVRAAGEPHGEGDGRPVLTGELPPHATWTIRYSDGARDCEALAVDPEANAILLLAKRGSPAKLYRAPFAPMDDPEVRLATPIAEVRIPRPTVRDFAEFGRFGVLRSAPTALDIAPDRRGTVVLTYGDAFVFPWIGSWADAFAAVPERIPLPPLQQGEAIAWDGEGLLVTSEGAHAPLYRVPFAEAAGATASEPEREQEIPRGNEAAAGTSEPIPVSAE
jgi:hypothetical protein